MKVNRHYHRCRVLYWRSGFVRLLAGVLLGLTGLQAQAQLASLSTKRVSLSHPVESGSGTLWVQDEQGGRPLTRLETRVDIQVTGLLARTRVQQTFRNTGNTWAEAIYVFPLPENAAVDRLRMQVGLRVIEGQIKERQAAQSLYKKARDEGRRASLVEQERPNLFTTSVANLGPGEEIQVKIEYQQTLRYVDGEFRLRFPLVVGPRYIPAGPQAEMGGLPGHAVADAARITPPVRSPEEGLGNPVSIRVELHAGFALQQVRSTHHEIHTTSLNPQSVVVNLAASSVPADRDFELLWTPQPQQAPAAAWFRQTHEPMEYGLLLLMPPRGEDVALDAPPRELIFVLDTSGSMHGDSIVQARQALQLALQRLRPVDRFNVVYFNQKSHALFDVPQAATPDIVSQARQVVANLVAEGGTEMLPAIRLALATAKDSSVESHLRQVVFLTDGSVGNEAELFAAIQANLGNSRLFTIGIGSAPNSHFMVKAAEYGRGTYTYIGDTRQVAERMQKLFRKLEQTALTRVQIHWPADTEVEMFPQRIPDLYQGEPMMLVFRSPAIPSSLTVSGYYGTQPWQSEIPLPQDNAESSIAPEWARRRIASLTTRQREAGSDRERETLRQEMVQTALEHHLVSPYTSLVAVETTPVRPLEAGLQSEAVKTNLPKGWHHQAVFGTPATATPASLQMLMALLLMGLSLGFFYLGKPRNE